MMKNSMMTMSLVKAAMLSAQHAAQRKETAVFFCGKCNMHLGLMCSDR
jgi:hypothetical protein